jgi:NTE family protein
MTEPGAVATGLILAGGLALGAYQRGALEVLLGSPRVDLRAVAGTSIGAINGAIIAGNPPQRRLEALGAFWDEVATDRAREWTDPLHLTDLGLGRHLKNWLNVAAVRLGGNPLLFRPRGPLEAHESQVPSLYVADRSPATISRHIDFDLLNSGVVRYCCATTDIETGECVVFDTAAGDTITVEHIAASASLLPAFPPAPVGGRLLGDGGFVANALLEPLLASDRTGAPMPLCVLLDLFSAAAPAPRSLEKAIERAVDLKFACQTEQRLAGLQRERALELQLPDRSGASGTDLMFLRYDSPPHETGLEKPYDFSRATLEDRRSQGAEHAHAALDGLPGTFGAPGLRVHRI